jgi:hypothetical protein
MLETITQNTIAQFHHAYINSRDTVSNHLSKRLSRNVLLLERDSFLAQAKSCCGRLRSVSRERTDSNDIRLSKFGSRRCCLPLRLSALRQCFGVRVTGAMRSSRQWAQAYYDGCPWIFWRRNSGCFYLPDLRPDSRHLSLERCLCCRQSERQSSSQWKKSLTRTSRVYIRASDLTVSSHRVAISEIGR